MSHDPGEFRMQLRSAVYATGTLLRKYSCGHPQWYAELTTASALNGLIQPTNHPHYDVLSSDYGRVQVKERVAGTDITQNRSNFGSYRCGDFDWAAIVLFAPNFSIQGALLIRCEDVLSLVRPAGHVKWIDVQTHPNVIEFTQKFREFEPVLSGHDPI